MRFRAYGYEVHVPVGAIGGSAPLPGGDHFAPRYLIGNEPAGDPNVAQAGAFRYIPDPGDGSGIALALAEAAITPGDIWIRPGTYDLGAGAVVTPLVVPSGIQVRGSGSTTVIRAKATGNRSVFDLTAQLSTLREMQISVPLPVAPVSGTRLIDVANGFLDTVLIAFDGPYTGAEAAIETLTAVIFGSNGVSANRVVMFDAPALVPLGGATLFAFDQIGNATSSLVDCNIGDTDVGARAQEGTRLAIIGSAVTGYSVGVWSQGAGSLDIDSGSRVAVYGPANANPIGVLLVSDLTIGQSRFARILATIENIGGPAAGTGIRISGTGPVVFEANIETCIIQLFATGVDVGAISNSALIVGNRFRGCTAAIADAGVLTEVGHNVET